MTINTSESQLNKLQSQELGFSSANTSIARIAELLQTTEQEVLKWVELQFKTQEANDNAVYNSNDEFNKFLDLNKKVEIGKSLFAKSYILFMTDRIAYKEQLADWESDRDQQKIDLVKKNILPFSANDYRLTLLIDKIQKKRITPFIGAGMSMAAGLPGWSNFLKKCAESCNIPLDKVNEYLNAGHFEKCADHILEKSHPDLLREKFQIYFKEPDYGTYAHEILARLMDWGVITTNYDRLLERTYERFDSTFKDVFYGPEAEMNSEFIDGNHVLLKMHGDIHRPSKRILTSVEYNGVYGTGDLDLQLPLPKFFSSFFSNFGILFVGCSLMSDRTMELLKYIKSNNSQTTHFAIVPMPKEGLAEREKFLVEHGILPIWYPVEENHEYVEHILTFIKDSI